MHDYPDIDPAFGNWLAGFLDGEGCFVIGLRRQRNHSERGWRPIYQCTLQVNLRADDKPILEEIAARTGAGNITQKRGTDSGYARKPQFQWITSSKADCSRMVELLDEFPLRAKKARDYAIWREAVAEWCALPPYSGPNGVRRDYSRLDALREQLTATRKFPSNVATAA